MATEKLEIIVLLKDMAKTGLRKLTAEFKKLINPVNLAKKALKALVSVFTKLRKTIFGLPGLIAGAGFGLLAKSFIDAASTAEQFRTRLTVLLGSVEEGNRLFKEMSDLAGRVPKTYEEIMASATALAGVMKGGVDEIKQWMPLIVDLSAATGFTLEETTGQIIRMYSAGAASADLFRERGVLAMLGFQAKVSYSAEETRKTLMKAWTEPTSKFKNASMLLANTWEGLMSMLGDAWFQFRNMVMDAGLFDYLKAGIKSILDEIQRLRDTGELQKWAQAISDKVVGGIRDGIVWLGEAIDSVVHFLGYMLSVINEIRHALEEIAGIVVTTPREVAQDVITLKKSLKEYGETLAYLQEKRNKASAELYAMHKAGANEEAIEKQREAVAHLNDNVRRYEAGIRITKKQLNELTMDQLDNAVAYEETEKNVGAAIEKMKGFNAASEAAKAMVKAMDKNVISAKESLDKMTKTARARREDLEFFTYPEEKVAKAEAQAEANLTMQKAFAAARLEMLKSWHSREIMETEDYAQQRRALLEETYAAEEQVIREKLEVQGKDQLEARAKLIGKLNALEDKRIKDIIKLNDEIAKARTKDLEKAYKEERITTESYYEGMTRIAKQNMAEQIKELEMMRADSFDRQDRIEKEHKIKVEQDREWYASRFLVAAARQDNIRLAQIMEGYNIRYQREQEAYQAALEQEQALQEDYAKRKVAAKEKEAADIIDIERAKNAALLKEERKTLELRKQIAELNVRSQESIGSMQAYVDAHQRLIDFDNELTKNKLRTAHSLEIEDMVRKNKSLLEINAVRMRQAQEQRDLDLALELEALDKKAELRRDYARLAQSEESFGTSAGFQARLSKGTGVFQFQALEEQFAMIDRAYQAHIDSIGESTEALFTMITEKAAAAARTIVDDFAAIGGPMQGVLNDLSTIFEWYYEKQGKMSKDGARAMKAIAIAVGTIDAVQAGIKGLLAGLSFGAKIGLPSVGMALGVAFMATAMAAGMAKVAMMKSIPMAKGGVVGGRSPTDTADNIPAQLTAGEFVQPVSAVRKYGTGAMEAIRRGLIPADALRGYAGLNPRVGGRMFAAGGAVRAQRTDDRTEQKAPTIVNVLDRSMFSEFFATPEGDQAFINVISRKKDVIRAIARER